MLVRKRKKTNIKHKDRRVGRTYKYQIVTCPKKKSYNKILLNTCRKCENYKGEEEDFIYCSLIPNTFELSETKK